MTERSTAATSRTWVLRIINNLFILTKVAKDMLHFLMAPDTKLSTCEWVILRDKSNSYSGVEHQTDVGRIVLHYLTFEFIDLDIVLCLLTM
jgi:hypothetical protein